MALLLDRPLAVDAGSEALREIASRNAPDPDAARRLMARVMLHLPRLADEDGRLALDQAEAEIERLAAQEATPPVWLSAPARSPRGPLDLRLAEADTGRAATVHEGFHYLRSYRDGLHLEATFGGRMAVLLTFASLDIAPIGAGLPPSVEPAAVQVLARVYAAPWAPRNSLSRALAIATRELRARDRRTRLLLTYLNRGIGFDGASYRAANWHLYGHEHGTRYAYLDGTYVTDRKLEQRFGTSDARALEHLLGDRLAFSRMPLAPLDLYAFAIDPRLRRSLVAAPTRRWARPGI